MPTILSSRNLILLLFSLYVCLVNSFIYFPRLKRESFRCMIQKHVKDKRGNERDQQSPISGSSSPLKRERFVSRNDGIRQARIARALRDELSSIITECDIKAVIYPDENLLKATSIVDVDISPDLSFAKVFISVLGNSVEKRQIFVWLCDNVGQVKFSLAKRLRHMKKVPDIFFKLADNKATADLIAVIEEVAPKRTLGENDDIDFEEA